MTRAPDILELIVATRAERQAFAVATVVRTVAVTAAKAGAKAVILGDGTVRGGWIGGGCARAAVLKAARESMADGEPRLVSIQPADALRERGLAPGDRRDGVRFAGNACPSRGTMDVFVEAVLPPPVLVIHGATPVAAALARLAPALGYAVVEADRGEPEAAAPGRRYVVVATQGRGDRAALQAALAVEAHYRAFVGSRAKFRSLRAALAAAGQPAERLDTVHAPAGLDIGAITPEEIALSILAEATLARRRGQRGPPA